MIHTSTNEEKMSSRFPSNSEANASELYYLLSITRKQFFNILKRILKKCFLSTTYTVISLACLNFQPHNSVLSVEKGFLRPLNTHYLSKYETSVNT